MKLLYSETNEILEVNEFEDYYETYSPRMRKKIKEHKNKFKKFNI